jgi:hypothetical protein
MTTQSDSFPTNHAIIVGRLGSVMSNRGNSKDRKPLKTITKRGDFGRSTQFVVCLETPFGEPFDLLIDAGNSTRGMDVLEAAKIGDFIAVEGALMMETEADRRYATSDEDDGRRVRDLLVRVATIRTPNDDEQYTQAEVWLEGTIAEPVTLVRHAKVTSAQFGRTFLRTTFGQHRIPCDVACLISTEHESAGYVYRAGNKLRVRGDITRLMTTQFGESVEQAVENLRRAWQEEKKSLEGKSQDEQRTALRRYRARRAALMSQARTFVLVHEVSPRYGAESISFDKAREERRAFVRTINRNGQRGARAMIEQVAAANQEAATAPAQPVEAAKPRRKDQREALADMPVIATAVAEGVALNGALSAEE